MKLLLVILTLTLIVPAQAQTLKSFTIKGDISNIKEKIDSIHIIYRTNGNDFNSAFPVKNGRFVVKGSVSQPVVSMLYYFAPTDTIRRLFQSTDNTNTRLFIQPGMMEFKTQNHITENTLVGSAYNSDFKEMEALSRAQNKKFEEDINQILLKNDSVKPALNIQALKDSFLATTVKNWTTYLNRKPQSPLVFYGIKEMMAFNHSFQGQHIKPIYDRLTPEMKNSYEGKHLKAIITTGNGSFAPEFSQADTSGIIVSLSSFRGKYVLLDFWGSWCHFCRLENPNVIMNFEKYKDRGFTVLSVAAETDKEKWLGAIRKDGVGLWTHVSDLKGMKNEVSALYCISGYPSNFLIDPDGKIIAQNLRGEDLEKKLAEIFK